MSRFIGDDPMMDDVTVGANRWVLVRRLRGGAGARLDHYRLTPEEARRLAAAVEGVGRHDPSAEVEAHRWNYTVRIDHRSPLHFVDGEVPDQSRAAVQLLRRYINVSAMRDPARRLPPP